MSTEAAALDDDRFILAVDVTLGILNIFVGLASIVMNFLVFFVYIKINWKHPTYFLFINITLHDAFSGFTGLYMGTFLFFDRPEELHPTGILNLCRFMGMLWSLTAFTTPTLLCIASIYRFMAIYMPYSYKDLVSIKSATIGVCVGWIVGLMSTMVPVFSNVPYLYSRDSSVCDVAFEEVNDYVMVLFILVPLLAPLCVLMLCNAAVLVHLCKSIGNTAHSGSRSQENAMKRSTLELDTTTMEQETKGTEGNNFIQPVVSTQTSQTTKQFGPICEWKTKAIKKDYHTATTVVLMTLNYITCYGLWIIYFVTRTVADKRPFTSNERGIVYIDATIKLMACMNSALNGVVHLCRGSHIRRRIRKMIRQVVTQSGALNS